MSRYQAPPAQIMQRGPGPLGMVGNYALQKGLQAGLDAYAPGAGTFTGGLAREVLPQMMPRFNSGGRVGADTYGAPAVYREDGGKMGKWMGWGPTAKAYADAARYYGGKARDAMPGMPTRETFGLDPDSLAMAKKFWQSPVSTTKQAMGYNSGGRVGADSYGAPATFPTQPTHKMGVAEYKEAGGKVGPLAKTMMKDKDGNTTERHYHNPLMAKPGGSDKKEG